VLYPLPLRATLLRAAHPWTDSIYAVVHAEGDYAASVAVINGATCNATNTSGCSQTPGEDAVGD